jgi:hypothetical protein
MKPPYKILGIPKSDYLNHLRAARKCIHYDVMNNYPETRVHLLKQKVKVRMFCEKHSIEFPNENLNIWLVKLYLSGNSAIVCRSDSSFYSRKQWRVLRKEVINYYGEICMRCGSTEEIVVDHIKPRRKFKELELSFFNLQVLCNRCNLVKSDRHIVDYRPFPLRGETVSDLADRIFISR